MQDRQPDEFPVLAGEPQHAPERAQLAPDG
jgi:hypothetical protein